MSGAMAVGAVLAPALFWFAYLAYKDGYLPRSILALCTAYGLGVVSAYCCLHCYTVLEWLGLPSNPFVLSATDKTLYFLYCVGAVGIVEEFARLSVFLIVCVRFRCFRGPLDGIIYASLVALGFATYESILAFGYLEGPALYARAFAAPIVHILFASIWGYMCGVAKRKGRSLIPAAIAGLLLAGFVHGVYDYLATTPTLIALAAVLVLLLWGWFSVMTGKLRGRMARRRTDRLATPSVIEIMRSPRLPPGSAASLSEGAGIG